MSAELAIQGDGDLLVREAQDPSTGHELRHHAAEQLATVPGGAPSGRRDARAAAPTGGEQPLLLELAIGARNRAHGHAQIAGELTQRWETVARAEPTRRDEVGKLAAQLLVGRGRVPGVEGEDEGHAVAAGCVSGARPSPPGVTIRPRDQPSTSRARGTVARSPEPTGAIQAR